MVTSDAPKLVPYAESYVAAPAAFPMKTILLIDDDEVCRLPAAEMLRRAGWDVLQAADGIEGVELAIRHRPEVILCDLLMPRFNAASEA